MRFGNPVKGTAHAFEGETAADSLPVCRGANVQTQLVCRRRRTVRCRIRVQQHVGITAVHAGARAVPTSGRESPFRFGKVGPVTTPQNLKALKRLWSGYSTLPQKIRGLPPKM